MSATSSKTSARGASRKANIDYVLEDQVGHLLRRAHQRHCGIFSSTLSAELTPQQFAALAMISQCGEVSQNQLGRLVAMDPATTQGVVRRLADRGLVVAGPDASDRRRHVWELTAAGRRVLRKLIPDARSISEQTLAPLSASERRTLLRLLARIS